jgi:(3,5-dihydroxyphenyl)acetyl-CoA 1,2-dioxygenase
MTTPTWPADLLARAGLPAAEAAAWAATAPEPGGRGGFPAAADNVSRFLSQGLVLRQRLPARGHGTAAEQVARDTIGTVLHEARDMFLRAHTADLYELLTSRCTQPLRVADLLAGAAARIPGLVPTAAELAAERDRALPGKDGIELAQGLLVAHILTLPGPGRHLIGAMLRPLPEAIDRLPSLRATGTADLGPVRLTRQDRAGLLELRNPQHLNAEDDLTLGPTECAVDLILLDPAIEVGVIRGGVVDHPRYQGVRVFGSGLNLTRLYQGRIGYLFYLDRDLGYVHKIFRGLSPQPPGAADAPGPAHPLAPVTEKLWIAAVERFAVGGACQLLHVVDHVIATRGSRLFLPARQEGIIPGASNLRLPRFVGDRAARQAIMSGREWTAGEPGATMLCDEVVAADAMDQALAARIEALTSSGLVNAAANRRALRAGQEPLDVFREYMATFALEQARCHLSPALVANLEAHWRAASRGS